MLPFPLRIWEVIEKAIIVTEFEVEALLRRFLRWLVVLAKEIVLLVDVCKHLEHEFLVSCPILEVIPEIGKGNRILLFHLVNTDLQAINQSLTNHSDRWGCGTRSRFEFSNLGNVGLAFSYLLQEHAVTEGALQGRYKEVVTQACLSEVVDSLDFTVDLLLADHIRNYTKSNF